MTVAAPAGAISRQPLADAGQDYARLLAEGTALVQQLSGQVWTNFNASDPGVTILEQLCYALTELSYRADVPVQDLLGAPATGEINLPRQGLYPAWAIMPVNPVTADDLRRLLLDRVPELANAWVTPLPALDSGGVAGLYRISVLARLDHGDGGCECDPADGAAEALAARVLASYVAHRALCEDVRHCEVLTQIPAQVHAVVQLDDLADPDAVLAQLLFVLGLRLSPEPARTSLAWQQAAGRSTSEIFNGPLMLRGFLEDEQLAPLPRAVPVESLLEAMAEVPGVLSVNALTLRVDGSPQVYAVGDTVALAAGTLLRLRTALHGRHDSVQLYRAGARCQPNPVRVRRLLDSRWAAHRQSYPLWSEYRDDYQPPAGQPGDLQACSSVQDQFPAVYGIGRQGLPPGAGTPRHAQARQLKGYLMVFDQLMADFFSQLAFVRELFSVGAGGDRSYACQSLRGIVPDAEPLLDGEHYVARLHALVAASDPVAKRQAAVLDLLLSLYASPPGLPGGAAPLDAKRALLARMVPATRDRGRGCNYLRGAPERPMAGLEVRCRIELAQLSADAAPDGGDARLHIVEWILLRHGAPAQRQAQPDEFSFRISAVMADDRRDQLEDGPEEETRRDGWRRRARGVVRANTPAHVALDVLFLAPRRMEHFLRLYDEWLRAMALGPSRRRDEACRRLAHFLRSRTQPAKPAQAGP